MACRPISILTYTVLKNEQAAWREEVVHMQQESVMKKKFFVTGTGENSYREWRKPMDLKKGRRYPFTTTTTTKSATRRPKYNRKLLLIEACCRNHRLHCTPYNQARLLYFTKAEPRTSNTKVQDRWLIFSLKCLRVGLDSNKLTNVNCNWID